MKISLLGSGVAVLAAVSLLTVAIPAQAGKGIKNAQTQTFAVDANTKIALDGNSSATLSGIKAGDHVGIIYTEANGALTASRIRDIGANPVKHEKSAEKKGNKPRVASTDLRAHGIVESVDLIGQTVTITEKEHHKTADTASPAPVTKT